MTTVYRAFNGTEFTSEKECLDYEAKAREEALKEGVNYLFMYNRNGDYTTDPDVAYIVHILPSAESYDDLEKGACYFIQLCKERKTVSNGITEEENGWFYWNEYIDSYCWIDDDLVTAIFNAVKNGGGLA